jgi:glycosyltransferase involved in cell wall biosynthesis
MRTFETAIGLQKAGLLQLYIAGFYFKPESVWGRALRRFASQRGSRLESLLRGRCHPDLLPERVLSFPEADVVYQFLGRVARMPRAASHFVLWRNWWFDHRLTRELAARRPAAVMCFDGTALRAFKRARALGILSVLDQCTGHIKTCRRLMREETERHPEWADSLSLESSDAQIERCCGELELADAVMISSEYAKQTLVDNGVDAGKIFVNPMAADISRFKPRARESGEPFRVLFVGQITQRKGIKYLLEAFQQVRLPNAELLLIGGIVGSGDALRAYLGNNIRHVPSMAFLDLHRYFQLGSIFVMPSLHESGVLAIHEALASGLPVIATPNCGSVVRDGIEGFIVPIRDVAALKEKIVLLYEDQQLREEMSRRARQRAEEFTWAAYQRRAAELFRTLLSGAGRAGPPAIDETQKWRSLAGRERSLVKEHCVEQ